MNEEEPLIVCLNYCVRDLETGYCLTCGRPPIPVSGIDLNPPTFAGISLKSMVVTERAMTTSKDVSEEALEGVMEKTPEKAPVDAV